MRFTCDIGDEKFLSADFYAGTPGTSTATGEFEVTYPTLTAPTTVTLEVEDPSNNTASYTLAGGGVTQQATGVYYRKVAFDEAGIWNFRWIGTTDVAVAEEGQVEVRTKQTG